MLFQVKQYPGYNFVGLVFGPGGDNQKRLEKVSMSRQTEKFMLKKMHFFHKDVLIELACHSCSYGKSGNGSYDSSLRNQSRGWTEGIDSINM